MAKRQLKSMPFHERFNIEVSIEDAQRKFINRAYNQIFDNLLLQEFADRDELCRTVVYQLANALGEKWDYYADFDTYIDSDFYRCLRALEISYQALQPNSRSVLTGTINTQLLGESEVDLGITWEPPAFVPTGAQLLDDSLVNESLRWLSTAEYKSVYKPFEAGLKHYLESNENPSRLVNVVRDMYEATEALARIVTERDKDLSSNRESFVKALKLSEYYKSLLKDYIAYGSEFRHAERLLKPRTDLLESEVEAFVYLTGLFIRLVSRSSSLK